MQATIARIKHRNVILMGICFMLMFTAYNPSQNYALALLGNHAYFILAIIYLVMAISNFFASAAVRKVGSLKLAMTISGYTYSAYLLAIAVYLATANTIFLVYIFSVIIGIGAGILWSAQGSSLTENSDPKARGASSGLFFSIMSICNITGNLLSFLMFYFGFQPLILFVLLAILCAIGCSGLLLLKKIEDHWVSLSDIEDGHNEQKAPQEDEDLKNVNADAQSVTSDASAATVSTTSSTKTSEENSHVELEEDFKHNVTQDVINMDEKKPTETEGSTTLWQEIWQSISMVAAPELLAQTGVFFFSAVYATYVNGPITAFFKDDRMQVGGIFAVNGLGKILFTYLGGKLKDRLSAQGFLKVLTGIMAVLMAIYFALQFMEEEIMAANPTTRYAVFYVIGFFSAFDGLLNIYMYSYLGKLYPKGVISIQAISAFKFVQSMSSALAFFYARFLNGMVQVIIMIVVLGATFPIAIKFNKDKGKLKQDVNARDSQYYYSMASSHAGEGTPTSIPSSPVASRHDEDKGSKRIKSRENSSGKKKGADNIISNNNTSSNHSNASTPLHHSSDLDEKNKNNNTDSVTTLASGSNSAPKFDVNSLNNNNNIAIMESNSGLDLGLPFDSISESETMDEETVAKIREERREKYIRELLTSEQKHVEELKTVVAEYISPLQKILERPQLKSLFCNWELIMGWNMQFLTQLKPRLEGGDGTFGDILIEMSVILRQLYSQYSENYEIAQQTYRDCMKIPEFQAFITEQTKTKKTNLLTSLNLPIHRMIMYDSLLKDIITLTPKDHPDYEDLVAALKLLRDTTRHADRVVEKRRNMDRVLNIQASLNNVDIAAPHRKYVFEGDLTFCAGGKIMKIRRMFLFNDILLVTKLNRKKKFVVVHTFPLSTVIVTDQESSRDKFTIRAVEDNITHELVFLTQDKDTWVQLLQSTIKRLNSTPAELDALREEEQEHMEDSEKLKRFLNEGEKVTKSVLVNRVIAWSEMKSEDVMKEVKLLAEHFSTMKRLYKK